VAANSPQTDGSEASPKADSSAVPSTLLEITRGASPSAGYSVGFSLASTDAAIKPQVSLTGAAQKKIERPVTPYEQQGTEGEEAFPGPSGSR
jgi:hypothetical protein